MYGMIHLFHGIVEMTVAKPILILTINTNCICKLKNDTNRKKTLIISSIDSCIKITAKLDIAFITSNGKNGKKMLSNLMRKEMTEICH